MNMPNKVDKKKIILTFVTGIIFGRHTIIMKKMSSRPIASKWNAVPETRQLHCIQSTGHVNEGETRNMLCCCRNCMHNSGKCENSEYTDNWKGYDMAKKKDSE